PAVGPRRRPAGAGPGGRLGARPRRRARLPFRHDRFQGGHPMSTDNQLPSEAWAKGVPLSAGIWGFGIWQPSPEVAEFWEGVARRELLLKWCPHCKRAFHPKRIICTACGATDLEWTKSKGRGKVYSFSEVHRAPTDTF